MSDRPFDMPAEGTWEERGGWVVRALMAEFGLKDFQAAGLVGNLGFESIGFTTLQEIEPAIAGSRGGWGWAQWTASRRREFEAYCQRSGLAPDSDRANYGFLVEELKTTHAYTLIQLRQTLTLPSAVWSVGQTYERPAGTTPDHLPAFDARLRWAEQALAGAQEVGEVLPAAGVAIPGDIDAAIFVFRWMAANLQEKLKARGLYTAAIDGDFGPLSREALRKYEEGRA